MIVGICRMRGGCCIAVGFRIVVISIGFLCRLVAVSIAGVTITISYYASS